MSLRCCPEVQLAVSIKLSVPSCLSPWAALDIDPSVNRFTGLTTNMFPSCLFYLQTAAPADFLHGGVGHLSSRCWFRAATGNWRYKAEVITLTTSSNFRRETKMKRFLFPLKKFFLMKVRFKMRITMVWNRKFNQEEEEPHPLRATWKLPLFNSHPYYVCVLPAKSQLCACCSFIDGFKPSAPSRYSHVMLLCPAGTFQLWGHSIQVDWAEPEKDVDEEVMQRVRVLYVRTHTHKHTRVYIYNFFV